MSNQQKKNTRIQMDGTQRRKKAMSQIECHVEKRGSDETTLNKQSEHL